MPGQSIPIISKREYNFANGNATIIAAKSVPVVGYREGVLLVRVHSGSFGGTSKIEVVAKTSAPSGEEPSVDFVNSTAVATAKVDNATSAAGTLVEASLTADFGAFLEISVVGTLNTGDCKAVISAEVVVKD